MSKEQNGKGAWWHGVVPLVVSLGLLLDVAQSAAQPTVDRGASILFFPRVVVDASADTVIQISNISTSPVYAACYYIAGDSCVRTDFSMSLGQRQPTHWVASRGRPANAGDPVCSPTNSDCDGAGTDPSAAGIPALANDFRGLLLCVESTASGEPLTGNHLVGQASVTDASTGDVSQYRAVGLTGNPDVEAANPLVLGGVEPRVYDGCPDIWVVDFLPDRAVDPVVGPPATVNTHFVILPCTRDLATGTLPGSTVQYLWFDQYGHRFSASRSVGCWSDLQISFIDTPNGSIYSAFGAGVLGNGAAQARLRAVGGGIIVLPYEVHHSGANGDATVATDAHAEGVQAEPDVLTLPTASLERAP